MEVYQEAVAYLESQHVPVEEETEVLEEDVFQEEAVSCYLSPLNTESIDFPDTPTSCSPEEMLERRLVVLKGILESEEVYLRELDALLMVSSPQNTVILTLQSSSTCSHFSSLILIFRRERAGCCGPPMFDQLTDPASSFSLSPKPMKALRAAAGTSQPVLSSQQVQTVFYHVPELREVHQTFYSSLKARLGSGEEVGMRHFELEVGDLFLKMVNHIGLYGGFIENYEKAADIVRRCTHPSFRTLAESMFSNHGADKARTKYTFEALLYKPLDRVTKTTLALLVRAPRMMNRFIQRPRDLLKTTPEEHRDYAALQETLRLSRSFLSGVNESSQSKREVTLSHGMRRQLIRDGFVVDTSEGERSLRHLFLYTDLLLCTRFKHAGRGKQDQYRFCWYVPLGDLRLRWVADQEPPLDTSILRTKMFHLRQQLQRHLKGPKAVSLAARSRKKLEQMELMMITLSPVYRLELHSPSHKSRALLFSSLYELEEWREAIHKLTRDNIETVPPDLLTLTGACVKLRMTQHPPLHSSSAEEDDRTLCGTLSVAIHSASGLQEPACVYVSVEVDGYEFYDRLAQTHSSVHSLSPHWDQELSFQVDGAQNMRVLCVSQSDGQDDSILGKNTMKLEPKSLSRRWRRQTLALGQAEVTLSLKFCPHPLDPPGSAAQRLPVFGVAIETVAQQEGVLVPHVVRCCVEEVERRGMDEVGIYRISGTTGDIGALKAAFNSNLREAVTRLRSTEVNAVSGVLKLYFRELPEPLIPTAMFQSLAKILDVQDWSTKMDSMLSLLQSCPDPNRHTFLYLLHHLQRVAQSQDVNKMSLLNLATVFGPSLLRPPVAGLGHNGPTVDISQEVVIQVQVIFCYLQCNNLPEAQTSLPYSEDPEDETTHL
ncbi:unnamed protein product [Menidia menidia]|uniref:(Atlantic silverside) hypothetical protein n=1 Tax=Menidia menidia TaxID=238744 RepID=A0A8S4B791_9TELE|nr:unnamed protein product [Menidia menidia]